MNPKNDRTRSEESRPAPSPAPKSRFRITKLEQRIAPKTTKYTHKTCGQGGIIGSAYY
jgi:hypothetical protein